MAGVESPGMDLNEIDFVKLMPTKFEQLTSLEWRTQNVSDLNEVQFIYCVGSVVVDFGRFVVGWLVGRF